MKERIPRSTTARKVCFAVAETMLLLILAASPVFIATVALARISAKKHFFTDVTGAICLSVSFASLLQLFRWHRDGKQTAESAIDDSQSSEGGVRVPAVPNELV